LISEKTDNAVARELVVTGQEGPQFVGLLQDQGFILEASGRVLNFLGDASVCGDDDVGTWQAVVGKQFQDVVGHPIGEAVAELIQKALAERRACSRAFRIEANGGFIFIETRVLPLSSDSVLVFSVDLTERRENGMLLDSERTIFEWIALGRTDAEILSQLIKLLEACCVGLVGSVLILDRHGKVFDNCICPSISDEFRDAAIGLAIGPKVGSCGTAACTGDPVYVDDVMTDPCWTSIRELAASHNLKAVWSCLIKSSRAEVLGSFVIYSLGLGGISNFAKRYLERFSYLAGIVLERENQSRELADGQEIYRTTVENASDGIGMINNLGYFEGMNSVGLSLLGYSLDEIQNLRLEDLVALKGAGKEENPLGGAGQETRWLSERRLRRKDGVSFLAEISFSRLDDGRSIGIFRDISARNEAEEALRASESKYRDVVEMSHDLIWSVDADGKWSFLNKAATKIYGYELDEMIGRPFTEFQSPNRALKDLGLFEAMKSGVPQFFYETEHLRKDGSIAFLCFNAIVQRDVGGNVIGTTGTASDITERKKTEAERDLLDKKLLQGQKLESLGVMAGGIAHDFNNLLTSILADCRT
jgi:PAS domain S-box-containing protein